MACIARPFRSDRLRATVIKGIELNALVGIPPISAPTPASRTQRITVDAKPEVRVLVADDHADVRSALVRLLDDAGDIQVVAAVATAQAAIAASQQLEPDVAVLDLNMPGGGLTAARHLAASSIAVVILTAHDEPEGRAQAAEAGADRFLVKSDGDDLVRAVMEAFRGSH